MDRRTLRLLVPRPVRRFPADLAVVLALDAATCLVVFLPVLADTPLRIGLGLAFALLAPGYALTAALFPERGPADREDAGPANLDRKDAESTDSESPESATEDGRFLSGVRRLRAIGGWERLALSLGLSLAVVPLLGVVLNFTPVGVRLVPIVVSVGAFTAAATVVAAVRRWNLPPRDRFRVPYRDWYDTARTGLFAGETRTDRLLNVALAVSMILALGSVGYAVTSAERGEQYTEFYLLSSTGDGQLTAEEYPTEFVRGESKRLTVGVTNHEGERTNYTVVVELQRVAGNGSANATVVERRDLHRFRTVLGPNETWQHRHTVTPTMTGPNLRLQYLLYRGEPPADPRVANAYEETHLWVNVTESRSEAVGPVGT
ncbi:DUF1616 domain-containing protein [Halorussus aquaticus]|uniref:DUF1616 domain-containing protein n=1 Tax=Halorussus aquaticus TaxID=2953748 RepID=A0ABD5PZW4_9EURY|nr:DUF1616 domain-containing protein [Halorussus aquaticus]